MNSRFRFTLGLFHAGRDGSKKIVRCQKHLDGVAHVDANRGKVAEYFVGCGIRANAILVFDELCVCVGARTRMATDWGRWTGGGFLVRRVQCDKKLVECVQKMQKLMHGVYKHERIVLTIIQVVLIGGLK